MESGKDPFKFMMEIDRFAADLHRLDEISVIKLTKMRDYRGGTVC